ncbi:GNAT family N-acetyltransferase [Streptomyces sp. NBC_01465]|uniref:GNAT family N-acetyltransferase n=1 Tax=Streptomyces sp. NBC_01465 TaxID=2903878 RepID=UPI002E36F860|nr:GNAT family N-acetyltransferase [Streptomyces sp. NBC_01465]
MSIIFPETVLHTGTLTLRPFTPEDIEDAQKGCSDELTQRWLPLPSPYTLDDATAWCTKVAEDLRTSGDGIQFAITDAADGGRLAGAVGLNRTDWKAQVSEIGYWVAPWARGRGIAVEVTRAIGRWLLTDQHFQRMELRAATENTASRRVALKAGLTEEGVLRNAGTVHDGRVDLVVHSLVPGDLD